MYYEREIEEITRELSARGDRARRLIGIDGPQAAGKSTLAGELAAALGASVIAADDFSLSVARRPERIADHYDWRRLEQEVFLPVLTGQPVCCQRYDSTDDTLREWHDVDAGRSVIVEGVYVLRPGVRTYFTYCIWVDAPHHVRRRRGQGRESAAAYAQWDVRDRSEDEYIRHVDPGRTVDRPVGGAS
jgi:uridine kinase